MFKRFNNIHQNIPLLINSNRAKKEIPNLTGFLCLFLLIFSATSRIYSLRKSSFNKFPLNCKSLLGLQLLSFYNKPLAFSTPLPRIRPLPIIIKSWRKPSIFPFRRPILILFQAFSHAFFHSISRFKIKFWLNIFLRAFSHALLLKP